MTASRATHPVWHVEHVAATASTNDLTARRPAGTVIVADRQTSGRGRHGRAWTSDLGGLWCSFAVATPGPTARWALLPLAAGWALRTALGDLGLTGTHLRWPNDLMIGPRKLAGILVERFQPDTAVIGIGLNLVNTPGHTDPALADTTTRLADHLDPMPSREAVLKALLHRLSSTLEWLDRNEAATLTAALDSAWSKTPVRVALRPDGRVVTGHFAGITPTGDLRLQESGGPLRILPALDVEWLREEGKLGINDLGSMT